MVISVAARYETPSISLKPATDLTGNERLVPLTLLITTACSSSSPPASTHGTKRIKPTVTTTQTAVYQSSDYSRAFIAPDDSASSDSSNSTTVSITQDVFQATKVRSILTPRLPLIIPTPHARRIANNTNSHGF